MIHAELVREHLEVTRAGLGGEDGGDQQPTYRTM